MVLTNEVGGVGIGYFDQEVYVSTGGGSVGSGLDPLAIENTVNAVNIETGEIDYDEMRDIARAFGDIRLTPTAFLIDKEGRIIKRYLGEYDKAEFHATVEKALAAG